MPVRYLSDAELARLSGWPEEIADEDAVTFFTFAGGDLAWLAGFNRDDNRLGVAVQLCTLPWLGWVPDDLSGCPAPAVARLADALSTAPPPRNCSPATAAGRGARTIELVGTDPYVDELIEDAKTIATLIDRHRIWRITYPESR
jgi:hypothetical protein